MIVGMEGGVGDSDSLEAVKLCKFVHKGSDYTHETSLQALVIEK